MMNNVVPLQIIQNNNLNDEILTELCAKKARGQHIDVQDYADLVDPNQDCSHIVNFIVKQQVATKKEWDRAIEIRRIRDQLGGYPKTAMAFLKLFCTQNNITVNYKKIITQDSSVFHDGVNIEDEIAKLAQDMQGAERHEIGLLLQQQRLFQDVLRCKKAHITTEDLGRRLRIVSREYNLPFTAGDIEDVIQDWLKEQQLNRLTEIFLQIMHGNQRMPISEAKQLLEKLVQGVFDTTELGLEMSCAILENIIWQTKRKIQNLPITNHLMVIFLGPQGVGKSTWMAKFFAPLCELSANTDFQQVADDRNIDLFDNFCLILDELDKLVKTNMDSVKHMVTAEYLVRRPMRTNNVVTIKQNAVFVGASNKELNQLIKDETGMRRFIGMRFKRRPDHDMINSTDFFALWQMVDELGSDPLDKFRDHMKAAQEEIRAMNPCEEWVYAVADNLVHERFINSASLYLLYREWESSHYGNKRLDHDEWSKELRRLIRNSDDFPVELLPHGKTYHYRFLKR